MPTKSDNQKKSGSIRSSKSQGKTAAPIPTGAHKSQIKTALRKLSIERRSHTHKQRTCWFNSRVSWPHRDKSAARLHSERRRAARTLPSEPVPASAQWQCAGPLNIGGRATSIVCNPGAPEKILLGTAGGGVWKSLDGGRNWKPTMRKHEHNIGALAIDPRNPKIVYCGTGEANLSADSYAGIGLYKSTNFGSTWRLIASSKKTGIPTRIGALAVDPFDSNRIFLGGVSHSYNDQNLSSGGLFQSVDGGHNWTRLDFTSGYNYWCHCVEFHPTQQGWIFATITERGTRNGIWISKDGGLTWNQASSGLPSGDRFGRARLAISPSQPDTIYAIAALADSDELLGIYRSDNAGLTWRNVTSNFGEESQMSYGLAITVHPANADHVLCGGVDLHLTTNGGSTWRTVTRWYANRGDSNYAHADHHALLMPPALPGRVYSANDGGLDMSDNGDLYWTNRSNGLGCTMFYDLEVAQSAPAMFGGGAQDNGTVLTTNGNPSEFGEISGGDGGWIVIDPNNPGYLFASSQFTCVMRYRNGQWTDWRDPMPYGMSANERKKVWMASVVSGDPTIGAW